MWNNSYIDAPTVRTYAKAVEIEASVKPIRGRKIECKPLGRRSKSYVNIRKEGRNIIIRFWRTDLITYKPNGDIIVTLGGWNSSSNNTLVGEILDNYICSVNNIVWISNRFGDNFDEFMLDVHNPNTIRFEEGRLIVKNPKVIKRYVVNRKGANKIMKRYKLFFIYVKGVMRLHADENGIATFPEEYFKESTKYDSCRTSEVLASLRNKNAGVMHDNFMFLVSRYACLGRSHWVFQKKGANLTEKALIISIRKILYAYHRTHALTLEVVTESTKSRDEYKDLIKETCI